MLCPALDMHGRAAKMASMTTTERPDWNPGDMVRMWVAGSTRTRTGRFVGPARRGHGELMTGRSIVAVGHRAARGGTWIVVNTVVRDADIIGREPAR